MSLNIHLLINTWFGTRKELISVSSSSFSLDGMGTILMNKEIHWQVNILDIIILHVPTNYVFNKFIAIDDKDPPWMAEIKK